MTKARTLADNFAADINGITAGTGITGGGTSGTVTITNDMATAINAKGDLVVGTGADAYARLAVASTAGYLLSVDSAEATGLKWAAAPASGFTFQTWSPSYTNLTIGNGTVTARYGTSGKFTYFEWYFKMGSTSNITGRITVSLPTTPKTYGSAVGQYVNITYLDSGTQIYFGKAEIDTSNVRMELYAQWATGTYVERVGQSASVPFTFTTNDEIIITGQYEEA